MNGCWLNLQHRVGHAIGIVAVVVQPHPILPELRGTGGHFNVVLAVRQVPWNREIHTVRIDRFRWDDGCGLVGSGH